MKFGEKLIKLRKEKALTQEELAEKLGVEKATIETWEEGTVRPDMDKLIQISNFFNVDLENLQNDNLDIGTKIKSKGRAKNINTVLVIVIIVGIILCLGFVIKFIFFKNTVDLFEKIFNTSHSLEESINSSNISDTAKKIIRKGEKSSFNFDFETRVGTQNTSGVEFLLDDVNTNNKKNKDEIVTVTYNGKTTSDESEIIAIKYSLDSSKKYEVTCDYDEEGYIYNVNIIEIDSSSSITDQLEKMKQEAEKLKDAI